MVDKTYNKKVHDFTNSNKIGIIGEKRVEEVLKSIGIAYERPTEKGKHKVDFIVHLEDGREVLVEVKNDVVAGKTGNLAFEIISTKNSVGWALEPYADLYIIFTPNKTFLFKKSDIIEITSKRENLRRLKTVMNKKYISIIMAIPLEELSEYKVKSLKKTLQELWY